MVMAYSFIQLPESILYKRVIIILKRISSLIILLLTDIGRSVIIKINNHRVEARALSVIYRICRYIRDGI